MTNPTCPRCGAPSNSSLARFCAECGGVLYEPTMLPPTIPGPGLAPANSSNRATGGSSIQHGLTGASSSGGGGWDGGQGGLPPGGPSTGSAETAFPDSGETESDIDVSHALWRFCFWVTKWALVVLAIDLVIWFVLHKLHHSIQAVNLAGEYTILGLFGLWVLTLTLTYLFFLGDSFEAGIRGMKPIPTPQEIAHQLHVELGRPPTLQEVASVQQMLATARNQDLVTAGIGAASWVAVREGLQGKR